jgi:hypothetical protein
MNNGDTHTCHRPRCRCCWMADPARFCCHRCRCHCQTSAPLTKQEWRTQTAARSSWRRRCYCCRCRCWMTQSSSHRCPLASSPLHNGPAQPERMCWSTTMQAAHWRQQGGKKQGSRTIAIRSRRRAVSLLPAAAAARSRRRPRPAVGSVHPDWARLGLAFAFAAAATTAATPAASLLFRGLGFRFVRLPSTTQSTPNLEQGANKSNPPASPTETRQGFARRCCNT